MEGFTVHKLNEKLVVSLYVLPGFRKLGSCVVRDSEGKKSGQVEVFYAGDFFFAPHEALEFEAVQKAVLKLAKNHAVKTKLGVATTRLNLSVALRKRIETNTVKDLNRAISDSIHSRHTDPSGNVAGAVSPSNGYGRDGGRPHQERAPRSLVG